MAARLAPGFRVEAGGTSFSSDQLSAGPYRIRVERSMDVASDAAEIDLVEASSVGMGDEVKVSLGYGTDLETVFTGDVAAVSAQGPAGVRVLALGKMSRLVAARSAEVFQKQSASDIVRRAASDAGLSAGTVDSSPQLAWFAIDNRKSLYTHLKGLADRLGFELYTDRDGKVAFHDPAGTGGFSLPGQGLSFKANELLIASALWQDAPAAGKVTVGGEGAASREGDRATNWLCKDESLHQGDAGSGDPELLAIDGAARTQDLARAFADGLLKTRQRAAKELRFSTLGTPQLDLGSSVEVSELKGETERASGYVRALRHSLSAEEGFRTEVCMTWGGAA